MDPSGTTQVADPAGTDPSNPGGAPTPERSEVRAYQQRLEQENAQLRADKRIRLFADAGFATRRDDGEYELTPQGLALDQLHKGELTLAAVKQTADQFQLTPPEPAAGTPQVPQPGQPQVDPAAAQRIAQTANAAAAAAVATPGSPPPDVNQQLQEALARGDLKEVDRLNVEIAMRAGS